MRRLPAVLIVSAMFVLATAYAAQARAPLGFGFHGGYGESKDADSGSPRAGVHLEIRPTDMLGLVGAIDYQFDEEATLEFGDEVGVYKVHVVPVSAMLRLYLPIPKIRPYATAGASLNFITYETDDLGDVELTEDNESSFGWLLGAGVQYDAAEKMGLFGEIRYESIDADREIGNAVDDVEDFKYDRWNAMAGITFYF